MAVELKSVRILNLEREGGVAELLEELLVGAEINITLSVQVAFEVFK